jgi:transposase
MAVVVYKPKRLCDATKSVTKPGSVSVSYFLANPPMSGVRPETTANSLTPCSGLPAAVLPGETCPSALAPGTRSTNASAGGPRRTYGSTCSRPCRNRTWTGSCSTQPLSEPTSTRQVKKTSAEAESLGRSRGGFSTKVHACCDALGNPRRFILSPGQQSDYKQAEPLLGEDMPGAVVADKGYDSGSFASFISGRQAQVVIPSRANAKQPRGLDENLYKDRNKIERFFNRIKHNRRIATRYDKTAASFLAFVHLAASMILLL